MLVHQERSSGIGLYISGAAGGQGLALVATECLKLTIVFSRHQILIKATSLGLKESSSRGIKRRRETEAHQPEVDNAVHAPRPSSATNTRTVSATSTSAPPVSASPVVSQTTTPQAASPVIQNQQRIPAQSTTPAPPTTAVNLPWPMPTVAANTPSPVVPSGGSSGGGGQADQRTSYYRTLGGHADAASKAPSASASRRATGATQFIYPNGSRLGKENGR